MYNTNNNIFYTNTLKYIYIYIYIYITQPKTQEKWVLPQDPSEKH